MTEQWNSISSTLLTCDTQVVGFGPSGLGIALAADDNKKLLSFLDKGLVYIDRRSHSKWTNLDYDIYSNSKANDFIVGIRTDGLFGKILECNAGSELLEAGQDVVKLRVVADFYQNVAAKAISLMKHYPKSHFFDNTEISYISRDMQGLFTTYDKSEKAICRSKHLVISTGSVEKKLLSNNISDDLGERVSLKSGEVLKNKCDIFLDESIKDKKSIVIIGGSHSAFSVVEYLLRYFGENINTGQIKVLVRDQVKLHYPSVTAALQKNVDLRHSTIDPDTQEVNRYSGLRKAVKHVYERIISGDESRVQLIKGNQHSASNLFEQASIIIQGIGYEPHIPKIYDEHNELLHLQKSSNQYSLTRKRNFKMLSGEVLENVFGIGLGFGNTEKDPYSHANENPAGMNLYHGEDAHTIVDVIFNNSNTETHKVCEESIS